MVAMVTSAAASLIRATQSCNGSIRGKGVMQTLMALQAAKLFVSVESSGVRRYTSALMAPRAKSTSAEVAPFCPLFSSFNEVSTRRFANRGAAATNGVSLSGDATSGGEPTERTPRKHKKAEAKKKAAKDLDQPKRPPSAYFIFMETFRKEYKAANPEVKSVTASAKAGGERWLGMSEAEKAPYVSEAAVRKSQYEQAMAAYKNGKGVQV